MNKKFLIISLIIVGSFNFLNASLQFLKDVKNGNIEAVEKFLEAGGNPNFKDSNNEHALIHAARCNHPKSQKFECAHVKIVELLIPKSDLNLQNREEKTAFIIAITHDNYSIANLLAKNDADIDLKDHDGNSGRRILRVAYKNWQIMKIEPADNY